ncbi:hypothetical protein FSP39_010469 [Pinctada imbricata]|uniref:Interleukin 17-like protein n=1 Tax=Pinctada imbricata TaxID=66713 RepID=A0AA88XW80_PINIB|nr:hypothetical protein FSP39_010469 [Pinctada imbricata]
MDASPSFLNERSLCPWDLVQDVNNNRYPHVLNFARCRCSRCLGEYGIFHCKPLTYRIPVLEKVCIAGEYEYIKTYLDVPVGCICARPNVVRMKKGPLWRFLEPKIRVVKSHWRAPRVFDNFT